MVPPIAPAPTTTYRITAALHRSVQSRIGPAYGCSGGASRISAGVLGHRVEADGRAALIDAVGVAEVLRPVLAVDHRHLCPIDLALALGQQNPVGQIRDVARGYLGLRCGSHQVEAAALQRRVLIGMLGQQPRGQGAVLSDQRPARPTSPVDQLGEPAGVVPVDIREAGQDLLLRGSKVGQPQNPAGGLLEQRFTSTPCLLVQVQPAEQLLTWARLERPQSEGQSSSSHSLLPPGGDLRHAQTPMEHGF
jgi:hypothetical protein